jgi:hypothetical protein
MSIYNVTFRPQIWHRFWSFFRGSFWHRFSSILDPIFEHHFGTPFWTFFGWGGRRGENYRKLTIFWPPKIDFCYIVVSTFFGPSGPPPGHPFWTRFLEKYSLFVGNDHFIGSILGVKKWGSFCKKLQNFKKFINCPPGSPTSILIIFDPPGPPP